MGRQTTVLGRQTRERDGEMDKKLLRRHISEGRRRETDVEKTRGRMGRQTSDRWGDRRETYGNKDERQMGKQARDKWGDGRETEREID
jgi:hypothetical protein